MRLVTFLASGVQCLGALAGDCIVQRGTNHAWVNCSGTPCLLAAMLIAAKPAPDRARQRAR